MKVHIKCFLSKLNLAHCTRSLELLSTTVMGVNSTVLIICVRIQSQLQIRCLEGAFEPHVMEMKTSLASLLSHMHGPPVPK